MAGFGGPAYDLARLKYYHECAKAYEQEGIDESYEADFIQKLVNAIQNLNLIEDEDIFEKKRQIFRAIFYLNALAWAVDSKTPEKNIQESIELWNKKRYSSKH